MDDKTKSIVAHIVGVGWLVALVMNQTEKGENTTFYLRQNLGLVVVGIAGIFLMNFTPNIIDTIICLAIIALWVLSLVGALSGEKKLTPGLGEMFQAWFKGIS